MTDRLLRQLLRTFFASEHPAKPSQCLAEIAAKSRRERQVVHYQSLVVTIAQLLSEFESKAKLLLGLDPFTFGDQTKTSSVGTFERRFRAVLCESFGTVQMFQSPGYVTAAARDAC